MAPVYRGGRTPSTTAARRAAFLGWVGMLVVPGTVLEGALMDHPGMAVTFSYDDGASSVAFQRGAVPADAQTQSIDLGDGWTVRTAAVAPETGLLARGTPRRMLVAGIAVSLLARCARVRAGDRQGARVCAWWISRPTSCAIRRCTIP